MPGKPPTQELRLRFYSRSDCHLCEQMLHELEPWRERLGFHLEVIDIDADAALVARYDHKVPVLVAGAEEICHHFLDEDMLLAHFGKTR